MKKINWKQMIVAMAFPLAVGGVSAWLTKDAMTEFAALNQPLLAPPGWLFPVVWTILFLLMGIASYLVYTSDVSRRDKLKCLALYGIQLIVNFFWSLLFFNLKVYLFAFFWLLLLWLLILETMMLFYRASHSAGMLLVPYLAWVTFAGYLNFGIYLLN